MFKKIRSQFAILKKFAPHTPVSTKWTNRVASKKHTSGTDKKIFLSDLIFRGLMGKHTEKSDQKLKKNFSVLAGLNSDSIRMAANYHLVLEPYARAITMGSQSNERCPNFLARRKFFLLLTAAPAKGIGHGMKWADLLYECDAWWNKMVLASEMKQE